MDRLRDGDRFLRGRELLAQQFLAQIRAGVHTSLRNTSRAEITPITRSWSRTNRRWTFKALICSTTLRAGSSVRTEKTTGVINSLTRALPVDALCFACSSQW